MTHNGEAGANGARNKKVKSMVQKLVTEYLTGRKSGDECMRELVQEAKK